MRGDLGLLPISRLLASPPFSRVWLPPQPSQPTREPKVAYKGPGAWEKLQPQSPVCKSVEPSPVRPGMSFQFSDNLDPSGMWVFGVQQIGSPENQLPAPLASRTLGITHHPSPGPQSEAAALVVRFRVFWVLWVTAPERGRAILFTRAPRARDSAGGDSGAVPLQSSSCSSQGMEGAPWPSHRHRGRLAPGRRAICFPPLLWSWGSGAGGPGQAGALKTLS